MQTQELAQLVVDRLNRDLVGLSAAWNQSGPVKHLVIDELLPNDIARKIAQSFPEDGELMSRDSLRERKKVGVEVDSYQDIVASALFMFQAPEVIQVVGKLTGLRDLEADPTLYASGISVMGKGDFLHPHLDNSHDGDQSKYRVLNLLYYVSPDWQESYGGNFEIWDSRVERSEKIPAAFNRLLLMQTDDTSWHSVDEVKVEKQRLCVSNYYFSEHPPGKRAYRHVTSFAGRPENPMERMILRLDRTLLNATGRLFPFLLRRTKHRLTSKDQAPSGD